MLTFLKLGLNFLTSKTGLILIAVILTLSTFYYTYNKGFNTGVEREKTESAIQYSIALQNALKVREEQQKKAIEEAVKLTEAKKKTEIVYKEKIVTVEKLIKDNKNLTSEVCKLSDEEFDTIKKSLEAIK